MTALHLAVTRAATFSGAGNTLQQQGKDGVDTRNDGPEDASLSDQLRHGCAHLLLAAGASTELEDHRKLCEQSAPQIYRVLLSSGPALACQQLASVSDLNPVGG